MPGRFRDATASDLERLQHSLVVARVFADGEEIEAARAAVPWRFQVNDRGDLVMLGVWRDHLPYLAIELMWCPPQRLGPAIAHVRTLAGKLGFSDVVSPPVAVEESGAYRAAGMRRCVVVAAYRLNRTSAAVPFYLPAGIDIRDAAEADLGRLLDVDARCFEPFWRYDLRHLERFLCMARLRVAERSGQVVGYTLCTAGGDEGLLGRLCVAPEHRRAGIGAALLGDAVQCEWDRGAKRVMLSTQIDNAPAQALYRRARFRDTGRRYEFLVFGTGEGKQKT
ncbi:MAG: GNAT family N-acetyltransferase [Actinobacteria bacterium]|nr:GNAT family N-acetyltransferase [Actinomycetota bacterium]